MREIKFRAWYKKESRWIGIQDRAFYIDLDGSFYPQTPDAKYDWDIDCLQVELMQFTGLKDKNCKEIYEGDIVKGKIVRASETIIITGFIEFAFDLAKFILKYKSARGWDLHMDLSVFHELEVIGNTYENPELL